MVYYSDERFEASQARNVASEREKRLLGPLEDIDGHALAAPSVIIESPSAIAATIIEAGDMDDTPSRAHGAYSTALTRNGRTEWGMLAVETCVSIFRLLITADSCGDGRMDKPSTPHALLVGYYYTKTPRAKKKMFESFQYEFAM